MKLLGFYLGSHDSNVTIYNNEVTYIKSERFFQRKHHRANLAWVESFCASMNFVPDAIAFSDGNRNGLGSCDSQSFWTAMKKFRFLGKNIPTYCIDHHYAHILSAWPIRSIKDIEYGVAIDGKGDNDHRVTILCNPSGEHPISLFQSTSHAYADFFNAIGRQMKLKGNALDFGGKVMGAHAYGEVDQDFIERFHDPEVSRDPMILINKIPWKGHAPINRKHFFSFQSQSFRDWLASVHALTGRFIFDLFSQYVPRNASVAYAGGAAQNTVYNELLYSAYSNMIIPPHCYDGGLSLGCLEFLRNKYKLKKISNQGFPFWQSDPNVGYATEPTINAIASHIKKGKIVGWLQGKGEIGPRALGHRSILYNPQIKNGKTHLNSTVKKREHWRPYAPSILASKTDCILKSSISSPYMLRAAKVTDSARENFPAVVHEDNTSRVQTVDEHNEELRSFHTLLRAMEHETNSPIVLNTSFNAAGGPIISTPEQALDMWQNSPLDVLCVGDKLFEK